ncbi:MAG: nodulation protein NfeD [Methanosarcinales archaeon]|nr:MAG: nodulation protein NfeD [Methanosarcinales archaeon]
MEKQKSGLTMKRTLQILHPLHIATPSLRALLTALVLLVLLMSLPGCSASVVYVIEVDDMITAGTDMQISRGIDHAASIGAEAVLIELDTPGGLVTSMDGIVSSIENSPVPVVVFVPQGNRAFSAGAFILLSGHIAAMAEGTATGAATPIEITATGTTAAENKTINAYAARIRGITEKRDRSVETAEKFVTEGLSLTADEALDHGVIDLIATDRRDLLNQIDGRTVNVSGSSITLHTKEAVFVEDKPSLVVLIVDIISNPQIAFVLFLIGMYGIIYGLASPGTYVPEMVGAISMILALYGMGMFSVSTFGSILIVAAMVLFIAEALTPTFGILTLGGVVCLIIGALMFPQEPLLPEDWVTGFRRTVFVVAILSAGIVVLGLGLVLKARVRKPTTGQEELIGMIVRAETDIGPDNAGAVKVHGETWRATAEEPVLSGETAVITDVNGLTLILEKT